MDERLVAFVQALRASGARVSLAESEDAARALAALNAPEREHFRQALRACLSKSRPDRALFDEYFPLYFGAGEPPLQPAGEEFSEEELRQLAEALAQLAALAGDARESVRRRLQELLERLLAGQGFNEEELQRLGERAGLASADDPRQRRWFEQRLRRQAGLARLDELLARLREALEAQGMAEGAIAELLAQLAENAGQLEGQLARYLGRRLLEQAAERPQAPEDDLLDLPFWRLREEETARIREAIRRLVARIRSRAALRQKRARRGQPDPRRTLRANMRYGGVPFALMRRRRQLRPSLVLLCDLSTSVRHCAEFLLTMIYELQDQARRTRSYVYIHDLRDISEALQSAPPEEALRRVLAENRPGYYSTDLGNGLRRFQREHLRWLDSRTTIIFLGDGRNNYNDPNLAAIREMRLKARRLLWFVPENRQQWGSGDSDMWRYAENADGAYPVLTLRQLARAVDRILIDGR